MPCRGGPLRQTDAWRLREHHEPDLDRGRQCHLRTRIPRRTADIQALTAVVPHLRKHPRLPELCPAASQSFGGTDAFAAVRAHAWGTAVSAASDWTPRFGSEIVSTTYRAGSVVVQLDGAQACIDRHVAAGADGRCLDCGQDHPCRWLRAASQTLARYGRLPVRRPGLASRGLTRSGRFGWLEPPSADVAHDA
jgi:hypothetical protein